jgi:MFS transporter, SP family, general alpha glucoside:H+ symporter
MGALYALPAFQKRYGYEYNGKYIIPAQWQAAIGMSGYIGQILGGIGANYYPLERFGPKRTLAVAVSCIFYFIFVQFFAPSIEVLFVGEFLAGIISGCFVVIAPTYASEIAPLPLRGLLTSYVNLSSVIGQFIGQGIMTGLQSKTDQWAYRIPFAIQWLWPIIVLPALYFAPESPYWLVRREKYEEAERVMKSLSRSDTDDEVRARIAMMRETNEIKKELQGSTTYASCFKGANLRRTEITVVVYLIQVIGGGSLMGYSTYFFELAGMKASDALVWALVLKEWVS